jgi:hypothetical protein
VDCRKNLWKIKHALQICQESIGAIGAWLTSLERQPRGPFAPAIHRNMAAAYESLSEVELAAEHRDIADEIEKALEGEDN